VRIGAGAVGLLFLVTALPGLVACGGSPAHPEATPPADPGALIMERLAGLTPDGPYRDPTKSERATGREGIGRLVSSPAAPAEAERSFTDLGFRPIEGVDPVTERPFLLFVDGSSDRGWGAALFDRSMPVRVVVQVPHPGFDIHTEILGIDLHRRVPGSVLLVAGAHRAAADGAADVAHNDRSLFHVLASEFAKRGIPQIQLHGFADRNLPGAEAVVSSAAASVSDLTRAVAEKVAGTGVVTCRAWAARCGRLEGMTNEQGKVAATHRAPFVHLELGWTIRSDPARRDGVIRAVSSVFSNG
jgi:hypothetical protein